jgi:hypothetical protein
MASQYNIQPGVFEAISAQDIGSYALNQWQHIKLDGFYPFLMSGITLKQGTTTIPPSAYELAQDDNATAQEVGLTGATLIGMIRITNISYAGVTLNITGNNYGTYVSNQANVEYTAAQIATRVVPSGANIADGEKAIFTGTSGLSIKTDNSSGISAYGSGTTYSTAGTLVRLEGKTYSATGVAGNLNKDPRLPENALFWFTPQDDDTLEFLAKQGDPIPGGMHTINNRAGANYQQNMKIASKAVGGSVYNFHMIHLDGSQVTGNTTLEGLLNVGAGNENIYIDYFAPDSLGTRTLIDSGELVFAGQSSSGENDTLGEVLEDREQGHKHIAMTQPQSGTPTYGTGGSGLDGLTFTSGTTGDSSLTGPQYTDGVNGTPRTGSTTRPKELTVGCSYIIVMVAA